LFLSEDQCLCRFLAASANIFSRSVNPRKNSRHDAQKLRSLIAAPQRPHRFAVDAILALMEFISTLSSVLDE